MIWTQNIRQSVAKITLTAFAIAALSMAANGFRHYLQDEALAAIDATEQAGYTSSPSLRVHVEIPTSAQNAMGVPAPEPPSQTTFIVLPAATSNHLNPNKTKVRTTRSTGSLQI